METTIKLSNDVKSIAQILNGNVLAVLGNDKLLGFEKAYMVSDAIRNLKSILSPEYMKPIMDLQGNRLGFKTDKDDKDGYSEDVVKNCLIEAVLTGVQPYGNQFNIIAGNTYITKEGFGYLLKGITGLQYDIVFDLPRINPEKTSAAVLAKISWSYAGESKEKEMQIPIKVNSFMGADAVLGKATRKARAWLFNTITGSEVSDGDITDIDSKVVGSKINRPKEEIEADRIQKMLDDCKTIEDLELMQAANPDINIELFNARREQLKK